MQLIHDESALYETVSACGRGQHLVEEVKAHSVVAAAVHRVHSKEPIGGFDEEAAQALDHTGGDPDVCSATVKFSFQLRGTQQR